MGYLGIALVCAAGLFAATDAAPTGKPNFSGSWRIIQAQSQVHAGKAAIVGMAIEQKGSAIHVVRTLKAPDGSEQTFDVSCTTDGKDCAVGAFKVSFWFDGPALVEMDVSDDVVSKITMTLDQPDSICATVAWIAPREDPDALVFEKK